MKQNRPDLMVVAVGLLAAIVFLIVLYLAVNP